MVVIIIIICKIQYYGRINILLKVLLFNFFLIRMTIIVPCLYNTSIRSKFDTNTFIIIYSLRTLLSPISSYDSSRVVIPCVNIFLIESITIYVLIYIYICECIYTASFDLREWLSSGIELYTYITFVFIFRDRTRQCGIIFYTNLTVNWTLANNILLFTSELNTETVKIDIRYIYFV